MSCHLLSRTIRHKPSLGDMDTIILIYHSNEEKCSVDTKLKWRTQSSICSEIYSHVVVYATYGRHRKAHRPEQWSRFINIKGKCLRSNISMTMKNKAEEMHDPAVTSRIQSKALKLANMLSKECHEFQRPSPPKSRIRYLTGRSNAINSNLRKNSNFHRTSSITNRTTPKDCLFLQIWTDPALDDPKIGDESAKKHTFFHLINNVFDENRTFLHNWPQTSNHKPDRRQNVATNTGTKQNLSTTSRQNQQI